jgi:hypothetical protein
MDERFGCLGLILDLDALDEIGVPFWVSGEVEELLHVSVPRLWSRRMEDLVTTTYHFSHFGGWRRYLNLALVSRHFV